LDGHFIVTHYEGTGSTPGFTKNMAFNLPIDFRGYSAQYYPDENESCPPGKIKLIQVIGASGEIGIAPHVDVIKPEVEEPGYVESGAQGVSGVQIIDGPGSDEDSKGKKATWFIEICAYCCHGTEDQRLLGCVRFNFDNQKRTLIPGQYGAEGNKLQLKLPAYNTESLHFRVGWRDWVEKHKK
jgi:hypothetical protein